MKSKNFLTLTLSAFLIRSGLNLGVVNPMDVDQQEIGINASHKYIIYPAIPLDTEILKQQQIITGNNHLKKSMNTSRDYQLLLQYRAHLHRLAIPSISSLFLKL